MPTIDELGKLVKSKYPGAYDDLDNAELGRQVKAKYPGSYDDFTDESTTTFKEVPKDQFSVLGPAYENAKNLVGQGVDAAKKAIPRSAISKTLDFANKTLNAPVSFLTKKVYAPLAQNLLPENPSTYGDITASQGLKDISQSKDLQFPSNVLEKIMPGIFAAKPGEPLASSAAKVAGRMGVDVAGDPLTYLSFGTTTGAGKIVRSIHEMQQAGESIKLDSDIARQAAKMLGESKPTPQTIKRFIKQFGAPGKNLTEKVAKGETSLASLNLPFTDKSVPLLTGEGASRLVAPLNQAKSSVIGSKVEKGLRELFSTKSGNPDFDVLLDKARSLVAHREGIGVEDFKLANTQANDLAKSLNMPREKFDRELAKIMNQARPLTKAQLKARYPKAVLETIKDTFHEKQIDAMVNLKKAQIANDPKLIDIYSKDVADYQGELNKLNGSYAPPPSIDPKLDAMVDEIRQKNASHVIDQVSSGMRSGTPIVANPDEIPHILTQEGRDRIREMAGSSVVNLSPKEFNDFLNNKIRREFTKVKPDMIDAWEAAGMVSKDEAKALKGTNGLKKLDELLGEGSITPNQYTDAIHTLNPQQINELGRQGKAGKLFGNKPIDKILHEDPIFASSVQNIQGERARTFAEFFQEMKDRGLAIEDNLAPPGWVKSILPGLEGHSVSPEVGSVMNRLQDFRTNPDTFHKAIQAYDKFHNLSKAWTLGVFPAYHIKNMVGNFWNNWLAGVENPDVYRQAAAVRMGKNVKFKDAFGHIWDEAKLAKRASELGVVKHGWFNADIARTLEEKLQQPKFLTLSRRNKVLNWGFKAGQEIEDNARMAHFIDRLRKGDSAEAAASSVKKFLFDYGDLTDKERKYLNRAFFFYTWTRKNIPLQLQHLVTEPSKYGAPFKAQYEIGKTTPQPNEKYLAEYVKENLGVRYRYDKKTNNYEYFMLGNWLPATDVLKLVHLHEIAASNLAFLPKTLIESLSNRDLYRNFEKIDRTPGGSKQNLNLGPLHLNLNTRLVHGLKTVRILNEIDRLSKEDTDKLTKFTQLMSGKNYTYNEQDARVGNVFRVKDDLDEIKAAIIRESKKPHPSQKEIERLQGLYQQKAKEF